MVCSYLVTHTLTHIEEVRRAGRVSNPKIKRSQYPFSLALTQKSRKHPNKQLLSSDGRVKVASSFGEAIDHYQYRKQT